MPLRAQTIRDRTEIELIRSLYASLPTTIIMSTIYIASFGVFSYERLKFHLDYLCNRRLRFKP